jgi:hypothetical protein
MNAEQTWQSVLEQLRTEMPRASFDTWVGDTHPLSMENGRLCVVVRNTYARDWLQNRLESTVNRLLVGILATSDIKVEFVTQDSLGNQDDEEGKTTPEDTRLALQPDTSSEYLNEVQPHHTVMLWGYFIRLLQKGEMTLTDLSVFMGFWQAVFRSWKRAGEPLEIVAQATVRSILDFAMGIYRSKLFEILPGKEINDQNRVIAAGHVEVLETLTSSNAKSVDANTYRVHMRPLLARVDATSIEAAIRDRVVSNAATREEARAEALRTLQDLAACDLGRWLVESEGEFKSGVERTVAEIVTSILEEELDDDLARAADLLHQKIAMAFGKVYISHYYIRIVVRTLGFSLAQAWTIAILRDRAWFDYETSTEKSYVIAPNGIRDVAAWVGVTPKIVKKWLADDKYFRRFVQMVSPEDTPDEKNTFFVIEHLEPMLGDVFGYKPWRWDVREAVFDALRLEAMLDRDLPKAKRAKIEQELNILVDAIMEKVGQGSGKTRMGSGKNPDWVLEKVGQEFGKTRTGLRKKLDGVMEKFGLDEGKTRTALNTFINPQLNLSKPLRTSIPPQTPSIAQQAKINAEAYVDLTGAVVPDLSSLDWSLKGLLQRNRTSSEKRKEINVLKVSFEYLVGATLFWGGTFGQKRKTQAPYNRALSDLTMDVPEEYIALAALPPEEIFAHLVGRGRGRFASESEWARLMESEDETLNNHYRRLLLTDLFSIEFPVSSDKETVYQRTETRYGRKLQ